MADNNNKSNFGLGMILGGVVLAAAVTFIMTGGDLGGTKKVESDADLPRVTSPATPPSGGSVSGSNTGTR